MALLAAKAADPALNEQAVAGSFDALVANLSAPEVETEADVVSLLETMRLQGFGTRPLQQVGLEHSNVAWVLEHKQGLPITLAVILIMCARHLGLSGTGINFPGHFLVRIGTSLVDPLRMEMVERDALQREGLDALEMEQLLQPASPLELGLRMLNNLKGFHLARDDWGEALQVLDYQLALTCKGTRKDTELCAALHYERGELWEQLGAFSVARDAYAQCQKFTSRADLAASANQQIANLDGRNETFH